MTNGTHNISKAFIDGKPKYTLWLLGDKDRIMGFFDSAELAKKAAENGR
ncbi:hypothetical protein [Nitrosospira sp. Nl5]|nr:hypothetical protein [Nitrosospira sp. Nl5]